MTEIWEGIYELASDDLAVEIAETMLRKQRTDSDPSDLNDDELRQQVVLQWDAIYTWQKNVEWHQRRLISKKQQRKALLKTVSKGHHRYKRATQVIGEHQMRIEKMQKRIAQEQVSLITFEKETRIRMTKKGWNYSYNIGGVEIFKNP